MRVKDQGDAAPAVSWADDVAVCNACCHAIMLEPLVQEVEERSQEVGA